MLDKLRIDVKLALIVGLMVIGLAVVGALAVFQGRESEVTLVRMTESDLELLIDVNALYGAGLQSGQATRNVLLNPADQAGKSNYTDANRLFLETIEHARKLAPAVMQDRLRRVGDLWTADDRLKTQIQELAQTGKREEAIELLVKKETPLWREARSTLLDLIRERKQFFRADHDSAIGGIHRSRWLVLGVLSTVLAVLSLLSLLIARSVARAIRSVVSQSRELSDAVEHGVLSRRGDTSAVAVEFKPIVDGMNTTMEAFARPIQLSNEYLAMMARGELPSPITEAYRGDFGEMKKNWNTLISVMQHCTSEVDALLIAAREGRLSVRARVTGYSGTNASLISGINTLLDSIVAPIDEANSVLERLARRDLRARMAGAYQGELAKLSVSMNTTAQALHDALTQVAEAAEQASTASNQIASSSQTVAQGTSQQASALEETSSSLEAIANATRQSADNAQQANAVAQTARSAATEGLAAMKQMSGAMTKIRTSAEGTSQIIKDINEIAFQTNLLALNAAVEAARAGESGRGFAVVAEEVRSLALRSKEAANRTEALIRQSVQHAGEGNVSAESVSCKLCEIAASVVKVTAIVAEISASAKEQAAGIEQVTRAIADIGNVTQQNAAASEESSSAAQELSGHSELLTAMVGAFRIDKATAIDRVVPTVPVLTATAAGLAKAPSHHHA